MQVKSHIKGVFKQKKYIHNKAGIASLLYAPNGSGKVWKSIASNNEF